MLVGAERLHNIVKLRIPLKIGISWVYGVKFYTEKETT